MSGISTASVPDFDLIDELRELVAALDRRVPRLERAGELDIARDAATLRDEAVDRLARLQLK